MISSLGRQFNLAQTIRSQVSRESIPTGIAYLHVKCDECRSVASNSVPK